MNLIICNGKVEVVSIYHTTSTVHLVIHLASLQSSVGSYVQDLAETAKDYLVKEGFIRTDPSQWKLKVGTMIQGS